MDPVVPDTPLSRRALLGAVTAGTVAAGAGCLSGVRTFLRGEPVDEFTLSVASVDESSDPQAASVAAILERALETAGMTVDRTTHSREEFFRRILVDHEFDLFVWRTPPVRDPAVLYEALHTRFADEAGLQNPYGFTNATFESTLDRLRAASDGDRRRETRRTLESFADNQPFTPLCRPTASHLSNTDRFAGVGRYPLEERYAYLDIEPVDDAETLTMVTTDPDVTRSFNPLGIDRPHWNYPTETLLYDSLATAADDTLVPWLAAEWNWSDGAATVTLRATDWHDGDTVTASDVAFTYDFLTDTTAGTGDVPIPAPIHRGLASAIEAVDVLDDRRLRIVPAGGAAAAERAFTVPILPEHIWSERTDRTGFFEVDSPGGTTRAIATDNVAPVGSGLFEYVSHTAGQRLELRRNDEHFSTTETDQSASIARIVVTVADDSGAAIDDVRSGRADVTLSALAPTFADSYAPADPFVVHRRPSGSIYAVGYNTRSAPLSSPYVRRTVARLLDKAWLVETVFEGAAEPIASPIGDPWQPSTLAWESEDPVTPYLGEDGELDVPSVRRAFEELGYGYDDEGNLLVEG
ncbi:ABC transporter substrate-binding protein [Halovivax cerinus]|uniref:ABC transporter substrate-binding protein n=1 Tax=Halovivax cerinus TaxID=1487865 RepID=A0ABD5NJF7_9EURY|nr:ABC transporter substrate-binding protein [Halovivax cerinus]